VKFAGGSDAGTPFNLHEDYWREFELMVSELGMSPREALRVATADAADLIGLERGRLQAGAVADVLVLDADIDSDARPLRAPRLVFKAGEIAFERD
jgi:imidazolonepropionase-like amidohydrolase